MMVLMDIEWIEDEQKHWNPTQIAAIRINDQYVMVDSFRSLIRPRNMANINWEEVAFAGIDSEKYMCAPNISNVLLNLKDWLWHEDELCWWHKSSRQVFDSLNRIILKEPVYHKEHILGEYVHAYLSSRVTVKGNPYVIAEKMGIQYKNAPHNAYNDADTMRRVIEAIHFPMSLLHDGKPAEINEQRHLPYQCDLGLGIMHRADCDFLPQSTPVQGFQTLKKCANGTYQPCKHCLTAEYRKFLRDRIRKRIDNLPHTFFYVPQSNCFHRYDCKHILSAHLVSGAYSYESCIKEGRIPCKICKPSPDDPYRVVADQEGSSHKLHPIPPSDPLARAVKRHRQAQEERLSNKRYDEMSETEKRDFFVLTQPSMAFWAARGYQSFHLRGCQKLVGLADLRGFSTFSEAKRAGLSPCKICRPSKKNDVEYSIPITSQNRDDDTIDYIYQKCEELGFSYSVSKRLFCLETPTGKWKIYVKLKPIVLDHINTAMKHLPQDEYHRQPRAFLSLKDAMDYIIRHDGKLDEDN